MKTTITKLRALGVHIPEGLTDQQLAHLAKLLNPWTVSTGTGPDGTYATTKLAQLTWEETASTSYGQSPADAALKLLLKQLEADAYPIHSTHYKQDCQRNRAS